MINRHKNISRLKGEILAEGNYRERNLSYGRLNIIPHPLSWIGESFKNSGCVNRKFQLSALDDIIPRGKTRCYFRLMRAAIFDISIIPPRIKNELMKNISVKFITNT